MQDAFNKRKNRQTHSKCRKALVLLKGLKAFLMMIGAIFIKSWWYPPLHFKGPMGSNIVRENHNCIAVKHILRYRQTYRHSVTFI